MPGLSVRDSYARGRYGSGFPGFFSTRGLFENVPEFPEPTGGTAIEMIITAESRLWKAVHSMALAIPDLSATPPGFHPGPLDLPEESLFRAWTELDRTGRPMVCRRA